MTIKTHKTSSTISEFWFRNRVYKRKDRRPVTIAVSPVPSIPLVTCSAVERAENPDGPLNPNSHMTDL